MNVCISNVAVVKQENFLLQVKQFIPNIAEDKAVLQELQSALVRNSGYRRRNEYSL